MRRHPRLRLLRAEPQGAKLSRSACRVVSRDSAPCRLGFGATSVDALVAPLTLLRSPRRRKNALPSSRESGSSSNSAHVFCILSISHSSRLDHSPSHSLISTSQQSPKVGDLLVCQLRRFRKPGLNPVVLGVQRTPHRHEEATKGLRGTGGGVPGMVTGVHTCCARSEWVPIRSPSAGLWWHPSKRMPSSGVFPGTC